MAWASLGLGTKAKPTKRIPARHARPSRGRCHTRFLPHPRMDAASRFCSFSDILEAPGPSLGASWPEPQSLRVASPLIKATLDRRKGDRVYREKQRQRERERASERQRQSETERDRKGERACLCVRCSDREFHAWHEPQCLNHFPARPSFFATCSLVLHVHPRPWGPLRRHDTQKNGVCFFTSLRIPPYSSRPDSAPASWAQVRLPLRNHMVWHMGRSQKSASEVLT